MEFQGISQISAKANRARDALFVGGSWIASMKYMLEYFGIASGCLSCPFRPLNEKQKEKVRSILHELGA